MWRGMAWRASPLQSWAGVVSLRQKLLCVCVWVCACWCCRFARHCNFKEATVCVIGVDMIKNYRNGMTRLGSVTDKVTSKCRCVRADDRSFLVVTSVRAWVFGWLSPACVYRYACGACVLFTSAPRRCSKHMHSGGSSWALAR
jgi:hypothetical protein